MFSLLRIGFLRWLRKHRGLCLFRFLFFGWTLICKASWYQLEVFFALSPCCERQSCFVLNVKKLVLNVALNCSSQWCPRPTTFLNQLLGKIHLVKVNDCCQNSLPVPCLVIRSKKTACPIPISSNLRCTDAFKGNLNSFVVSLRFSQSLMQFQGAVLCTWTVRCKWKDKDKKTATFYYHENWSIFANQSWKFSQPIRTRLA